MFRVGAVFIPHKYKCAQYVDNLFSSDEKSSRFDISIGPYHGQYGTCGSSYNDMTEETGDTMFFKCPRNVLGPTLKITKSGSRSRLTLCEVFVYGHGKIQL